MRMRSSNRRSGGKARPASFDVSLLINNEKNVSETSKDDLLLNDDIEVESGWDQEESVNGTCISKFIQYYQTLTEICNMRIIST